MNAQTITGRAFIDGVFIEAKITIEGSRIAAIERRSNPSSDAPFIVPGFIDIHVHGGAGADFMDATPAAIEQITAFHARHGTTALAATTLSGSTAAIAAAVRTIAAATLRDGAAQICGIHFEGPFVSREKAGAQDPYSIRSADRTELETWLEFAPEVRRMMTIAPEVDGALDLIREYCDRMLFSIGHTTATFEQATAAIDAGASHFTHLFNAMPPLHHREPGAVGAALSSAHATAELVADGIHLHPAILAIAARSMKGRVALVTDSMRACGMADGHYKLYEHDVQVSEGAARLADGTLAGSVLTMDGAVRNLVMLAGLRLEEAIPCATEVPARILGIDGSKGRIAEGFDADLVMLDEQLAIQRLFVRGAEITR